MSCKKRRQFYSESHAQTVLWVMRIRGEITARPPRPVRCEECGFWHLIYVREGAAGKRNYVQPFLEGL